MDKRTEYRRDALINGGYMAFCILLFYLACRYALRWLLPFVLGYLIAMMVRPAALSLARSTGLDVRWASRLVLLATYAVLGAALVWFSSNLAGLIAQLARNLPAFYRSTLSPALSNLQEVLSGKLGRFLPPETLERFWAQALHDNLQEQLAEFSGNALNWLGSNAAQLPGRVMSFFLTILCSLLISTRYTETRAFLARQLPDRFHGIARVLRKDVGSAVCAYIRAYSLLVLSTFLQLALGLRLLKIEAFLPLAAGIALLDLLPVVGVGSILIPWAIIHALCGNHALAAGLLLLCGIVVVMHNILEPRLVGRELGINPLVSLCAVYLGYRLFGMSGMMMAPIAVHLAVNLHRSGAATLWK